MGDIPASLWVKLGSPVQVTARGLWLRILDLRDRHALCAQLNALECSYVLDLSGVEGMDDWGLATLAEACEHAREWVSDGSRSSVYDPLRRELEARGYPRTLESVAPSPLFKESSSTMPTGFPYFGSNRRRASETDS